MNGAEARLDRLKCGENRPHLPALSAALQAPRVGICYVRQYAVQATTESGRVEFRKCAVRLPRLRGHRHRRREEARYDDRSSGKNTGAEDRSRSPFIAPITAR